MDWRALNKKQQQTLLRLGLLALLGVALLLAGGRGEAGEPIQPELQQSAGPTATSTGNTTVAQWEQQLAQTLSQVKGAGQVTVQISVSNLGCKTYAYDVQRTERNTSEDNGEVKQQTTELQENRTIAQVNGGQGGSVLLEETMPEVQGVLIVATGAAQASVQEQLLQAAATVLQLSTEKIIVLPGKEAL